MSSASVTISNVTYYFFADRDNDYIFKTFINGTYIKNATYYGAVRLVATKKYLYAHDNGNFMSRLTFNLDSLVDYYSCGLVSNPNCFLSLKEMFYDSTNNLLYIPDHGAKAIYIFDEDLKLLSYVSVNSAFPMYGLVVYNDIIYISGSNTIYALKGNTTIQTYTNVCPSASNIQTLSIDPNGYLIYPCYWEKTVRIMVPSGTLTLNFGDYTSGVKVDSDYRLIVTSTNSGLISIYY